jgi:4-amino-4-deoxy-L-arabinose transferase-like glycosyltransferase
MLIAVSASGDPALAAYRDDILYHQTAGRYLHPWHHFKPWWYYLVEVIPPFWLPLSALLPWAVPAWRRRIARGDARYLLLLSHIAFVVLFFSLSAGKRGVYLLPALPALALAIAPLLPGLMARAAVQRAGAALLALVAFVLAAFPVWFLWIEPGKGAALVARHGIAPWGFFWGLAAAAVAWLAWGRLARGSLAFAGFMLSGWVIHGVYGYPLLDHTRSAQDLMLHADAELPNEVELGLVDWEEQFVLQARRPVTHFGFRRGGETDEVLDGLAWISAASPRALLIDEEAAEDSGCVDVPRAITLGYKSRRNWLLVGSGAVLPACQTGLATRQVKAIRAPTP